ncbi:ATP-dependent nuclease [Macromonas bipunctata]|uniref:ATP-dependent nuclease n=1 Tax=Macromonas bipunctata TaxID=183670 RepID=UPI000C33DCFB|nr:DUF2813 domain-containing protein [Macromonas bipunctata]
MYLTKIQLENFRGIKTLELPLGVTTVLVGENNSGKTTVLHALRACLQYLRTGGRAAVFDEFDFHFENSAVDPASAPSIEITLTFEESEENQWSEEIERQLGGDGGILMPIAPKDFYRVQLKVTSKFSSNTSEIITSYDFLDAAGKPLAGKSPSRLSTLQQLRPLFYLSALRDAGKEFSKTSQFWSPFVKNSQIDNTKKTEIEKQLQSINEEIIKAHGTFNSVREHLSKVQELVSLGSENVISIDAIPARIFDMLNKTQVSIASATGARLPIARHGEGTQSLTVLMLFDAFLRSELARKQGVKESKPIVALEEPEAHLHPTAIRSLWKTIKGIDGQKIIATHSGDLLSEVDISDIRRLYRKDGKVHYGMIPNSLLRNRERNKFNFLVRRTRGELFFARCWLLGEGETEAILFPGVAEVLNIDLEQAGVRCVEYRQGDISYFLEVANALGIPWFCLIDCDGQGKDDFKKAKERLPARAMKDDHLFMLPDNQAIEEYLANNGFIDIYENEASPQKIKNMTAKKGEINYVNQLVKCIGDAGKPAATHAIIEEMRKRGPDAIPNDLKNVILRAAALGGRG